MRHSRLLYTAAIRSIIIYGAPIWSARLNRRPLPITSLAPLQRVQNECLQRITGAYRRTPQAALEREAAIMPLDLYLKTTRYQQADKTRVYPVEVNIQHLANEVQRQLQPPRAWISRARPCTSREISTYMVE